MLLRYFKYKMMQCCIFLLTFVLPATRWPARQRNRKLFEQRRFVAFGLMLAILHMSKFIAVILDEF